MHVCQDQQEELIYMRFLVAVTGPMFLTKTRGVLVTAGLKPAQPFVIFEEFSSCVLRFISIVHDRSQQSHMLWPTALPRAEPLALSI